MTTPTSRLIVKARASIYYVDCPRVDCNGYLTVPESGDMKWTPEDFTPDAIGHCDECDATFRVRR